MTNSPTDKRALELNARGRRLMQQGHFEEAIPYFKKAWQQAGLVAALNNWATALYYHGRPEEALQVLGELRESLIHPYAHALASRCYAALGDTKRAREHLQQAIRDFDAGRFRLHAHPDGGKGWIEYTMIIKEAAMDLGDYRLVLQLHNRWPGRDLAHGAFLAGVAAFNLGKFNQAVRIWERVRDPDWTGPLAAYGFVAQWADLGVIPPFLLDTVPPDPEKLRKLTPEEARRLPVEGSVRLLMLATAFLMADDKPDEEVGLVAEIIRRTGDWGIDLGRRILESASTPIGLKFGAARALTEAGVFQPGEPIPIVHEGRRTQIVVRVKQVADGPMLELEEVLAEARSLWQKGKRKAALKLLTGLHDHPVLYPPAVLLEAEFLRAEGKLDEALKLLHILHDLLSDHPAVLFSLAAVHFDLGDRETARRFADAIDPSRMSPAFQRDVAQLKAMIAEELTLVGDHEAYIAAFMDSMREEMDERPIRPDVKLATALRRIPVPWLNAAARRFAVQPQRRRPEREKALAAAMLDRDRLQGVLADEPPEVREALGFVLAEGGWVKLHRLTRRFGDQTGDGFYWDDEPPVSTLGRLRMLGILHVGRMQVDGRNHKVAVVPVELRPLLMP